MRLHHLVLGILLVVTTGTRVGFAADEIPKGFEDKELLKKVMVGEVVITEVKNDKKEQHLYLRSFYKKVSPEAYIKLRVNHERYPTLFKEILEAKTTKVNADRTVFDYKLDVLYEVGPISFHVYPECRHTVTYPKDAVSEGLVKNEITNYTDKFQQATQNIRLIPYEGGILVEDEVHVILKTSNSQTNQIKKMLVDQFKRFTTGFRTDLGGNP